MAMVFKREDPHFRQNEVGPLDERSVFPFPIPHNATCFKERCLTEDRNTLKGGDCNALQVEESQAVQRETTRMEQFWTWAFGTEQKLNASKERIRRDGCSMFTGLQNDPNLF